MMFWKWMIGLVFCLSVVVHPAYSESLTIAAAADLKFAFDEVVASFNKAHPADRVSVIYGSSGKFQMQIQQGAPYDLFFSADISYARALKAAGFAVGDVQPYALGRIVLWSASREASRLKLNELVSADIQKIAIANPQHAPYGKRAEEALKAAGVWDAVSKKLVYGENVAQTAQFVESGNAQVGIIALSLALNPTLAKRGGYFLIPDNLHQPLEQGFVITKRAENNPLAPVFSRYIRSGEARAVMARYGFVLPSEVK